VYERHLSSWEPDDFVGFGLVRQALLQDYIGREYGSFILSRKDPRNLRAGLFSQGALYAGTPGGAGDGGLEQVSRRVQEKVFELEFIKRSASYRLAQRIKGNPVIRRLVDWKLGSRNLLTVKPLPLEGGAGAEAWVLGVHARADEPALPWDVVRTTAPFVAMASPASAHGSCRMHSGLGGELVVRTTEDPAVRFMAHVGSTRAAVTFNGRTEVVELRSPHPVDVIVYPGRRPMVETRPAGMGGAVIEASPRERTRCATAEALTSEAVGAA
jgi:hypothetical protein